jgi:hypothetical protein
MLLLLKELSKFLIVLEFNSSLIIGKPIYKYLESAQQTFVPDRLRQFSKFSASV